MYLDLRRTLVSLNPSLVEELVELDSVISKS